MIRRLQDLPARALSGRAGHPAIVSREGALAYAELNSRADALAAHLHREGVRAGDRVLLLMPKGADAIVAMLGVLRANALYVPLDTASPAARLAPMIAAADGRFILTTAGSDGVLRQLAEAGALTAAHVVHSMRTPLEAAEPPPREPVPDNAAHILFTSGSTGVPKGVIVTHDSVLAFLDWAVPYFGFREDDRHSGHPPLHFDLSTFDIFGTFAAGATLYPVPAELNLLPHRIADFIRANELTQWFSVPSVLNLLARFDLVRQGDFPALRRLLWCGEVLPTPTLQYLMERLPGVRFTNLYGPTEAAIASSYYTVPAKPVDEAAAIPIGTACAGEELRVLDEQRRELPPGETGELYIGGVGLSPGYWRDPEKTAGAFVDVAGRRLYRTGDLARRGDDGLFYFAGRADTQIKTRGYRVELGEVDAALATVPALREAAAVAVDTGGFEGVIIGCAFVAQQGEAATPASIRAALSSRLPSYMLPARWLALEALPRNANGKIDRRALGQRLSESAAS